MELQDKLVLITGASSGIGAAAAQALAARGARVALVARTRPALEAVAGAITAAGGQARVYPADLADPAAASAAAAQVQAEWGVPDVLVNSAGAGRWLFTEETEPAEAVQMMNAPYFAAFFITRACLPAMLARRSGWIVNVNSPAARIVWPGATGYVAARWALYGFTEALRADLAGTGLGVTSVVCGEIATPYFTHNPGVLERAPWIARRLMPALNADEVAAALARGVERGEREVVRPFLLRVFLAANSLAPHLIRALVVSTGWRHDRVR